MNSVRLWLLLTGVLLLAACGTPADPTPPATEAATAPTPTAVPPTATPSPTETAVPAATATLAPPAGVTFTDFNSPSTGFNIRYPDDWLTADQPFDIFASNPDFVDGLDAGEEGALVMVIPLNAISTNNQTLLEILQDTLTNLAISQDAEVLEPARVIELNGQQTATTTLRGVNEDGNDLTAVYTVYRDDDRLLLLLSTVSTTLLDQHAGTVAAMRNSFQITPIETVETAVPTVRLTGYVSDDGQLAFAYPQSWIVQAGSSFAPGATAYIVATGDELVDGLDPGESGSALRVDVVPTADFGLSPDDDALTVLDAFTASLDLSDVAETVSAPQELNVGGLPAARLTAVVNDGNRRGPVTVSAIVAGDTLLLSTGFTSEDTESVYAPVLDLMLNSLIWAEASLGGFLTYEHPERPLTFRYPADWAINDADPDGVLLASSSDALAANDFTTGGFTFVFSDAFDEPQDPEQIVQLFADNFSLTQDAEASQSIMGTLINELAAATAVYRTRLNGTDLRIDYTAVANQGQVTVTASTLPAGETAVYLPVQALIANSIQIDE